jgi:hypothetical protein
MAKVKKRAQARTKTKRGKATVKTAPRKTAKRTSKQAKSKVRRAAKRVKKPAVESARPQEDAVVEATVMAVTEEPGPTAAVVAETAELVTSAPAEVEREESPRPASDADVSSEPGEPPQLKVA